MKKGCLYSLAAVILVVVAMLLGVYSFTSSLVPKTSKELINFDNPKQAVVQLEERINIEKKQLNDNYSKLSSVDWCNYKDKNFALTDIPAALQDKAIRDSNQYIIHHLMMDYAVDASIKSKKLHDKKGAKSDLDEFEKLVEKNKYISNDQETVDFIKRVRNRNGL